jgi:hypothetical protein
MIFKCGYECDAIVFPLSLVMSRNQLMEYTNVEKIAVTLLCHRDIE